MKKAMIILILLVAINKANAQSAAGHGKWEENSHAKTKTQVRESNEFEATEMSVANKMATFSNLPDLRKSAWAVVTDANGDVMLQKSITPENNYIDLHKLSKGELYFVTILYKNKSQKGFVVHL